MFTGYYSISNVFLKDSQVDRKLDVYVMSVMQNVLEF